jgi:hypothetical protein
VFTGAIPFSGSSNHAVMASILQSGRPERPKHSTFTEELWSLMQRCWNHDKDLRPSASEVLGELEVLTCRRLAGAALTNPGRVCLINAAFSDHNWSKVINNVCNEFAQGFLDAVDEASLHKGFCV